MAGLAQLTPGSLSDGRSHRQEFSVQERGLLFESIQLWSAGFFGTIEEAAEHMELTNSSRTWESVHNFIRNMKRRMKGHPNALQPEFWTREDILEDSEKKEKKKTQRLLREAKKIARKKRKQLHYPPSHYEGSHPSSFSSLDSDGDCSGVVSYVSIVGPGEDMPFHAVKRDDYDGRKTGLHALGEDWKTHRKIQHDLRQISKNQERIYEDIYMGFNRSNQIENSTRSNERVLQDVVARVQRIEGHLNGDPPQPEEPYVPNGWEVPPNSNTGI